MKYYALEAANMMANLKAHFPRHIAYIASGIRKDRSRWQMLSSLVIQAPSLPANTQIPGPGS